MPTHEEVSHGVAISTGVSRVHDAGTPGLREPAEARPACDDRHVRCSVTWRSKSLAAAALFGVPLTASAFAVARRDRVAGAPMCDRMCTPLFWKSRPVVSALDAADVWHL